MEDLPRSSVTLLGGFAAEAGGAPVPDSAWRLGAGPARRDHDRGQPRDGSAAARHPGGVAREEGGDRDRRQRRSRRGRRGARPRPPHGRGAGGRPDPPDAVHVHPGAARSALAEGDQRLLKATNLARLSDETIDSLARLHQDTPGPQCEIHVHQMGGAVARVGQMDTAFPERSMPFVLNAVTGTPEPALLGAHTE